MEYNIDHNIEEELLGAWIRMSVSIRNRRLTPSLPFNEAIICYYLSEQRTQDPQRELTAADLCRHTNMLKSLMNGTLNKLEKKGLIERVPSRRDKRKMYVRIKEENETLFWEQHRQSLEIVRGIIEHVGEDKIRTIVPVLEEIAAYMGRDTEAAEK